MNANCAKQCICVYGVHLRRFSASPRLCGSSFSSPSPPCLRGEFEFEPSIQVEIKLRPVIDAGVGKPNSARIEGATSTSDGPCAWIRRLQHNTPGTSSASAQWSALQAESLSNSTSSVRSPKHVAQTCPIAAGVADNQIRRQRGGIAGIHFVGAIDAANHLLPIEIAHRFQPRGQFGQAALPVARRVRRCHRARGLSNSDTDR